MLKDLVSFLSCLLSPKCDSLQRRISRSTETRETSQHSLLGLSLASSSELFQLFKLSVLITEQTVLEQWQEREYSQQVFDPRKQPIKSIQRFREDEINSI